MLLLELGGGQNPIRTRDASRSNFINMDAFAMPGVDIVHDATVFPWPFESNSVQEIYSSEFIEHIHWNDITGLLEEAYRVLAPGGKFVFECPDGESIARQLIDGALLNSEYQYCMRGLFGDQSRPFDYHRNLVQVSSMRYKLNVVGFIDIQRYPAPTWREDYQELFKQFQKPEPHFEFTERFVQSVKLCMIATKPNE